MRWCLAVGLCLFVAAPVVADRADAPTPNPDALGHAMDAFVAAGGSDTDEAMVLARQALARCRADVTARRLDDARRRCGLAEAAFALARERALLALARSRAR